MGTFPKNQQEKEIIQAPMTGEETNSKLITMEYGDESKQSCRTLGNMPYDVEINLLLFRTKILGTRGMRVRIN